MSSLAQVTWARSANITLVCHGQQSLSLPFECFPSTYCEPSIAPGVQHTVKAGPGSQVVPGHV